MFEKLKARWKVNTLNLVLVITTFALGGSLCGYAGRKILLLTNLDKGVTWFVLYFILITLLWPICVILISIPLGQFNFFKNYLVKIWRKMSGAKSTPSTKKRIAIFASGTGTNAGQIIAFASGADAPYEVALIVCNKPGAGVLVIAERAAVPAMLIEKEKFFNGDHYLPELQQYKIDFIVLAGFLWKVPPAFVAAFPDRIINIHPALLPKFGGHGMYGNKVHEAVLAAGEKESGISIHYVDEYYDEGKIIFQASCPVNDNDTAATLAQKIHKLEHAHYPRVIAETIQK